MPGGTAAAAVGQQLIGTTQVRVLLDALATAGLVSVLARPSLTAVSGETASLFFRAANFRCRPVLMTG